MSQPLEARSSHSLSSHFSSSSLKYSKADIVYNFPAKRMEGNAVYQMIRKKSKENGSLARKIRRKWTFDTSSSVLLSASASMILEHDD